MKKLYIFLVLIILSQFSYSQTYHPLIRPNSTWDVMHKDNSICGYAGGGRYFFDGDTTINNLLYKIIQGHNIISINYPPYCPPFAVNINFTAITGFMREDTILKKVYVFDQNNNADDLLYDFNLNTGDTLQSNYYAGLGMTLIVDSVSTISLFNGSVRKIIFLNSNEHYIESIGGSQGLLFPLIQGIGFSNEPHCVIENGSIIYSWTSEPCLPIVGIEESLLKNKINIYPNPVLNDFNLNFPSHKEKGTLEIFDVLGNLIMKEQIPAVSENKKIDFSKVSPGIYLCKLTREDKNEFEDSERIIFIVARKYILFQTIETKQTVKVYNINLYDHRELCTIPPFRKKIQPSYHYSLQDRPQSIFLVFKKAI